MKKYLFVLLLVSFALINAANCQIQRGNILVGGDLADFDIGLGKGSRTTVQIIPKAAWFIKDNTALGGYLKLGYSTARGLGSDFTYGIGALVRKYSGDNSIPAVQHTRLFLEGNVGIEGVNHSQSSTNTTTNGLGLGIGPGLAYFITPNIGLEGLIKYNAIVGFGTTASTGNVNLNVGFQVYLTGKAVRNATRNMQ